MQFTITHGKLSSISETLSPSHEYFILPETITVTGSTSSYSSATGEVVLTELGFPTSVTASAQLKPIDPQDLTNTKWQIKKPSEWVSPFGTAATALNLSINNKITCGSYESMNSNHISGMFRYYGSTLVMYISNSDNTNYPVIAITSYGDTVGVFYSASSSESTNLGDVESILEITTGDDATNQNLVTFLKVNATQIIEPSGPTITIDGVAYSVDEGDSLVINQTGLYNSTKSSQIYTFTSTGGRFFGFNLSSGQISPSTGYEITDTFLASADLTLYSVEQFPSKTFDLSSLSLAAGSHTITVKLAAEGYGKSGSSNEITYNTSGASVLRIYNVDANAAEFEVYADGTLAATIDLAPDNAILDSDDNYIKASDGYLATSESSISVISFTISDTSYQANEGMTWREWIASEYNTGGFGESAYDSQHVGIGRYEVSFDGSSVNIDSEIVADRSYQMVSGSTNSGSTHSGGSTEP